MGSIRVATHVNAADGGAQVVILVTINVCVWFSEPALWVQVQDLGFDKILEVLLESRSVNEMP